MTALGCSKVRHRAALGIAGVEELELVNKTVAGGAGAHSGWGDPKVR
ncbi:MAG: hypothetical protein NTX87_03165 [Planctomycetota bacterium]|nr:hypothetical protein [Planctomycetota bacterium]